MAEKAAAKPLNKGAIYTALSESTGLAKKDITKVFEDLAGLIGKQIGKKGPGVFVFPGLLKIKKVVKPATKARQGRNPQNGEPMMIKAKPARTIVKVQALKSLKEMI